MTKESRDAIISIFKEKIWEDYSGPTATFIKDCDSNDAAKEYLDKADELLNIFVTRTVEVGDTEISQNGPLFGGFYVIGNTVFLDVSSYEAKTLSDTQYWYNNHHGRIVSANFLEFWGRNNGKHWDELLKNEKKEVEA